MILERIVVGLDVGTTKVCTLVGKVSADGRAEILGLGIEPSQGMHKGTVVDVSLVTDAISTSKRQAERTSGYEIGRAFVSVAGKHITSVNSQGITGITGTVRVEDIDRALKAAQAVNLPHNREVLHVIPRSYTLDGQEGIHNPLNHHAFRLEVEAHIITAASSSLRNLEQCVNDAGLSVDRFVLNPLASGEASLTDTERESGVVVIDIGGGTTDVAVFIENTVWHTSVIEVGGNHITSDIAHVLHLPSVEAERIKMDDGNALPEEVHPGDIITVEPFGEGAPSQIYRLDLARIIEARVEEIFSLVMQELKRSGYDGLLPAGVVLTGGTANLRNIRHCASRVMNLPVRVATPEGLVGLTDRLDSPAYATAAGLLRFGQRAEYVTGDGGPSRREGPNLGKVLGDLFGRLLPD